MPASARANPILRSRTKALPLLALISTLVIAAHLITPTTWPSLGMEILHTLHGPGFALVALLILGYLSYQCRSTINYALAAALAIGIGVVSEIAQIPGDRGAQVQDLVVDALGIFGALGICASLDKSVRSMIPGWARLLLPASAGAALAIVFVPTLWLGYALIQQINAFPSLLTFEHRWETAVLRPIEGHRPTLVAAPVGWPGDGSMVARAVENGRWGIFLSLQPLPDWRGYENLRFLAATTGEESSMHVCIRDWGPTKTQSRNQFCRRMALGPLAHEYSISFSEIQAGAKFPAFDFSRVDAVVFSAAKPGNKDEILIDDIRLD